MTSPRKVSESRVFDGTVGVYAHQSAACRCEMRFSIFVPDGAGAGGGAPMVTWLSGLTCTEDNFTVKAGAYRVASELGLVIVAPDTSPRGEGVPDDAAYDLGQGAGFYVDATRAPWNDHFNMYGYVTRDLPGALAEAFPVDPARQGIMGHSMGGHGALTIWLKNPGTYRSVSAFAPICAPTQCPWGRKALTAYLGPDEETWAPYDATRLMRSSGSGAGRPPILVDQGLADGFLEEQLHPHLLEDACAAVGQAITVRRHEGFDHSYFFIATFIEDHLRHHARLLKG